MIFRILLYGVLVTFLIGLVYRFRSIARKSRFFERDKEPWAKKIFNFTATGFLFNTLFQIKLFKAGKLRWLVHGLVISGFSYLLVVHALDDVTSMMFSWYQPGIGPFRFLRNLAGVGVGLGCILFLVRRMNRARNIRETGDKGGLFKGTVSIFLILSLVGSGFLLEALGIISEPRFDEMVEEYSGLDEAGGLNELWAYWARNYHLVLKETIPFATADFEIGKALHQEYCLDCHEKPDLTFVSSFLAGGITPIGNWLAGFRIDLFLYWFHYGAGLLLLAFFPFSQMFHLIAVPVTSAWKKSTHVNLKKQMGLLEVFSLTACTNCGFCSQVCNVYPNFQITGNREILPHVKIDVVKIMAGKGLWDARAVVRLRSGNDDCTRCGRCGDICPSGIDLVRLWTAADHLMESLGFPDNCTQALGTFFDLWTQQFPLPQGPGTGSSPGLADRVASFEHCVQCTICTNACPVVAHDLNQNDLGPH